MAEACLSYQMIANMNRALFQCLTFGYLGFINQIINFWWLVVSHLSGCFCILFPNFWEGGGDLQIIFSHFVNGDLWMILDHFVDAVWVLRTLRGGMETQLQQVWIHLNFLHSETVGKLKYLESLGHAHSVPNERG